MKIYNFYPKDGSATILEVDAPSGAEPDAFGEYHAS